MNSVIAHQGGWDEIVLFVIPVLVALGAVRFVDWRQRRINSQRGEPDGPESEETVHSADGPPQ